MTAHPSLTAAETAADPMAEGFDNVQAGGLDAAFDALPHDPAELLRIAARHVARRASTTTRLIEALGREVAWSRMLWQGLLHEVQRAEAHGRGGQHAGTPRFAAMPHSVRSYLTQEAERALGGARQDVPLADLIREALREEHDPVMAATARAKPVPPEERTRLLAVLEGRDVDSADRKRWLTDEQWQRVVARHPGATKPTKATSTPADLCRCGHGKAMHVGALVGSCIGCASPGLTSTKCWSFRRPEPPVPHEQVVEGLVDRSARELAGEVVELLLGHHPEHKGRFEQRFGAELDRLLPVNEDGVAQKASQPRPQGPDCPGCRTTLRTNGYYLESHTCGRTLAEGLDHIRQAQREAPGAEGSWLAQCERLAGAQLQAATGEGGGRPLFIAAEDLSKARVAELDNLIAEIVGPTPEAPDCPDDGEPPPTEDPRDYDPSEPLCACGHPEHAPLLRCRRPGCACESYTPHPATIASVDEHRAEILAEVKRRGSWPTHGGWRALRLRVQKLGARFDEQHYEQALSSLKLTDAQWNELKDLERGPCGHFGPGVVRLQNALTKAGYASVTRDPVSTCRITDAGRERLALGRGPR